MCHFRYYSIIKLSFVSTELVQVFFLDLLLLADYGQPMTAFGCDEQRRGCHGW